jgi:hypothetical protein
MRCKNTPSRIKKIEKLAQVFQKNFCFFGGVNDRWEIALVLVNKAVILRQAQDRSAKKHKSINVQLFYINPCSVKSYGFCSGNSGIVKSQKNEGKVRGFDKF